MLGITEISTAVKAIKEQGARVKKLEVKSGNEEAVKRLESLKI